MPCCQLQVEVGDQAVLRALDDVAGEPLVERVLQTAFRRVRRDVLLAEVRRRRRRGGICAERPLSVFEEQVLGQLALLLRDRRVALELLGVDDREVEAGLGAVVQEDRVSSLAAGVGQAERDVRDAEDASCTAEALLDQAQPSIVSTALPT